MKKLLSLLMALMLCLLPLGTVYAAEEPMSFTPIISPEMDVMATAGEAVKNSDNRAMAASLLMFDFIVYQLQNDMEMETRALWNDCLIGRSDNIVSLAYDLGDDEILLVVYDTIRDDVYANYNDASLAIVEQAFINEDYSCYTVDGEDWTDYFQLILQSLSEDE